MLKNICKDYVFCIKKFGEYKKDIYILFFLEIIIVFFMLLQPYLFAKMIDQLYLFAQKETYLFLWSFILVMFINTVLSYVISNGKNIIHKKIAVYIKENLFAALLKVRDNYLLDNTAKIYNIITADAILIREYVLVINNYFLTLITFILAIIISISISYEMTLLMIISIPISIFVNQKYGIIIKKESAEILDITDILNSNNKIYSDNIRDIQSNNAEMKIQKTLINTLSKIKTKSISRDKKIIDNRYINRIMSDLIYVVTLLIITGWVFKECFQVSLLISFLSYGKIIQSSISNISNVMSELNQYTASLERIKEFEDNIEKNRSENFENIENCSSVLLKEVSLVYSKPIFEKINFRFSKEYINIIIGKNGAGKTSLLKIIGGEMNATSGSVCFDDLYINSIVKEKTIGIIRHPAVIYPMSLRDNLLMGNKEVSDEQLLELIDFLGIFEDVEKLPQGLTTLLDNSIKLSLGQRNKIQVVRLIMKNPSIVLMDEPLANMDKNFIDKFPLILERFFSNALIIITGHLKLVQYGKPLNILDLDRE